MKREDRGKMKRGEKGGRKKAFFASLQVFNFDLLIVRHAVIPCVIVTVVSYVVGCFLMGLIQRLRVSLV